MTDFKKLCSLMVVAIAITFAAPLHALLGCDDDDKTSVTEVGQHGQPRTADKGTSQHHEVPGGACCELAIGTNVMAYSTGAARYPVDLDRSDPAPVLSGGRATISDSSISAFFRKMPHGPPHAPQIYVALHSLLI